MHVTRFNIAGPLRLCPQKFSDNRGYFSETFNLQKLQGNGINVENWVQDNQSFSSAIYTLRGLHIQRAPQAQAKLVRVLQGRIFDVAVDVRPGSSTFGQWLGLELSAENFTQLYIPAGFLHGFLTLSPDTEVLYKVSAPYAKSAEAAVMWNDPAIAIAWPLPHGHQPTLSEKDAVAPAFAALAEYETQQKGQA